MLVSELDLTSDVDGVPTDCVVNFDNLHTLPRASFRRHVNTLSAARRPTPAESSKPPPAAEQAHLPLDRGKDIRPQE